MKVVWGNKNKKKEGKDKQIEVKYLLEYFSQELFVSKLKATTKDASLDELADLFVKSKIIRKKSIVLEMLRKRETLGSTGIGKGVAIPHGRTTAAMDVKIAFGKSEEGMNFDAIDKKPVNLVFMVLAPPHDENNRYLAMLGKFVEVLSDVKNRNKLKKVETFDEFIQVCNGVE